jgi:hypothetical protein
MKSQQPGLRTVVAAAFMLCIVIDAKTVRATAASDEIALDEVEFSVTDNGQVKEHKFMRELDAQDLGRQMRKKGLPAGHRLSVKRLAAPKLRFLDKSGRTNKEIILGEAVGKTTAGVDAASGPVVEANISRHASVSANKRTAVVIETRGEPVAWSHGEATSEIALYDATGAVRWSKKMPHLKIATAWKLADDGSRLILLQGSTKTGVPKDKEPREQLVAFDSGGAELLRFPKAGKEYALDAPIAVSPNGRFVAVRARKERKELTLLIDVEKQMFVEIQRPSFPISVGDDGKAKLGLMSGSRFEEVDGKDLLKPIP